MHRGMTLDGGDGQLTILEVSDQVRVAERYVDDGTPHWHKFWMPLTEARELEPNGEISEGALGIVETLTDTHPKETPFAEERLLP